MRGGGKASGSRSVASRGRAAAPNGRRQASDEESDEAVQQTKKPKVSSKEQSAVAVAREEMESLLAETEAPKKATSTKA